MMPAMELLERIERTARDASERPAYVHRDGSVVTYAALVDRIAAARGAIRSSILSTAGVIVLHLENHATTAAAILATLSSSLDALLVHPSATPREVSELARRVSARLVISSSPAQETDVCCEQVSIHDLQTDRAPAADVFGDLLLPTSGSTDTPKIVRRSAAALDAVSANTVEAIDFRQGDRVLAAVPLAHSYGIEHGLLAPLWAGATVHLFDGLDLDAISAAPAPFDIFPAVPSMLERLADAGATLDQLSKLRTVYSAGAPLPGSVSERFTNRFGVSIGQLYGATEIGTVTYRPGDARPGSDVGWPMREVSIRILNSGEIAIRSPSMFRGYFDTDADLVDGHFLTGDLGRLTEDGALALGGRSKLLINVGGIKVNPLEVEAAISSHPGVAECLVLPMKQSETVERLRAIVVPRIATSPPTAEALRAHVRRLLASYKVPRVFDIRTSPLPRSAAGKVVRSAVVEA